MPTSVTPIPGLPPEFAALPGVALTPPPAIVLADTRKVVEDAVAQLRPNEKGIFTWIATTKGINFAVVDKVNNHVDVTAWVGKSWGEPLGAGVAGRIHW